MDESKPEYQHPNAQLLLSATKGFDYLFSNDIEAARKHFQQHGDPFHLMGLGVCAFLEAALGMEPQLMAEATRCLALSEAGTRRQMRTPTPRDLAYHSRFPYGLEWEILNADAVVLLGLTHALSESYMGYLQCMYSLNSAHSKFTKLYKTVFPNGLPQSPNFDPYATQSPSSGSGISVSPSLPTNLNHKPSHVSLTSDSSASSVASASTVSAMVPASAVKTGGFLSRWTSSSPSLPLKQNSEHTQQDGPVENLIIAGTAFGFGLFNLVFSLLPKKVQGLVGFLGFKHDRKLALQALSLAASKNDVHGVFAGLVLMTYYGVVLLLAGYQANEQKILAEYKAIVDNIQSKHPEGALWILNRAKIMRMSYNPEGAIVVLQEGLKANRAHSFVQADMLLIFELAWILLGQRRYQEAADAFMKITELNSWSHGTYYFIAAGCYLALGNHVKAQSLLEAIPDLIDRRKINGKDLPTEVFIKKKMAFYKEKQMRRVGNEKNYVEAIKINLADEIGIFWNNHARIGSSIAQGHIDGLVKLTPPVSIARISLEAFSPMKGSVRTPKTPSSVMPKPYQDLDNPDELALRALLLGINYRALKEYEVSRGFLNEAYDYQSSVQTSTWVGGVTMFELAVLDLKEAEERDSVLMGQDSQALSNGKLVAVKDGTGLNLAVDEANPGNRVLSQPLLEEGRKTMWADALKSASAKLDIALSHATSSVDLSSRLDSRIAMLRDEIATKTDMLGVAS